MGFPVVAKLYRSYVRLSRMLLVMLQRDDETLRNYYLIRFPGSKELSHKMGDIRTVADETLNSFQLRTRA